MISSFRNNYIFRSLWQESLNFLVDVLDCNSALVSLVELPILEVFSSSDRKKSPFQQGSKVNITGHYCEETFKTRNLLHISDATKMDRWKGSPEIQCGLISYYGAPVRMPDGSLFGTICVLDNKENFHQPIAKSALLQIRALIESQIQVETLSKMDTIEKQQNPELIELYRTIARNPGSEMIPIPVCSHCRKFRTDSGKWVQLSAAISQLVSSRSSHGICPECLETFYPDLIRR